MTGQAGLSLFDTLVAATGIDRVVAPFTVRRLLMRIGIVRVEALRRDHIAQLQPHLEIELRKYLTEAEYKQALADIAELAAKT